jgi:hypothetical protein
MKGKRRICDIRADTRLCHKPAPEELAEHVQSNSTGVGQSFVLLCQFCKELYSISADGRTYLSKKHQRKAAEKFASQGWRMTRELPVCPSCADKLP